MKNELSGVLNDIDPMTEPLTVRQVVEALSILPQDGYLRVNMAINNNGETIGAAGFTWQVGPCVCDTAGCPNVVLTGLGCVY